MSVDAEPGRDVAPDLNAAAAGAAGSPVLLLGSPMVRA